MWRILVEYYNEQITQHADPRIKGYPLMDSIKGPVCLVALYLLIVKIVGPELMKNRRPFQMTKIIIFYNAFQTIYSAVMFSIATYYGLHIKFNFICQLQDFNRTDYYMLKCITLSWIFLMGRFVEFIDTIFFVLRKKNSQITNLHVIHHAIVPLISWVGVKLVPGGHYVLAGYVNAFVHTFMYLYYMLSALGPKYKKYLWWKQYLTKLQLVQFAIVIVHTIWTLLSGCNVPKIFGYLVLFQAVLFYKLFINFYKEAFKHKKSDIREINNDKVKPKSFDIQKLYDKYSKFFEMCIPNQHLLMDDDSKEINMNDTSTSELGTMNGKIHSE